jgi:uncharacterized phiE125 gp8 family phage protein
MQATIKIAPAQASWITLADAKVHLKVDADLTADDTLISSLIKSVQLACENRCQRTLITTTWELVLDCFSDWLRLLYPRVLGVTSVKYIDQDGVEQTLASTEYQVDVAAEPGRVTPAYGKTWPTTRVQPNAVRVRYTAGYGAAASDIPEDLVLWMKLHLGHYYTHRDASVTGANVMPLPYADGLLDSYRVWSV